MSTARAAVIVIAAVSTACDSTTPVSVDEPIATVEIWPTNLVLPLRAQQPLWVLGRAGLAGPATWSVSDPSVLDIDSDGVVTALDAGEALITAQYAGISDTAHARVIELDFASVTTGFSHACALTTNGTAYCWGADFEGTLGTTVQTSPVAWVDDCPGCFPRAVAGQIRFRLLKAGRIGRCGLTSAGVVYCWGYTPQQGYHPTQPTAVSGLPTIVDVTVGFDHSCGVASDGLAYCWGANERGQLGVGDTLPHAGAVTVAGTQRFRKLSAGAWHTCGLTTEAEVYCWGSNEWGALARDRADSLRTDPSLVPGDLRYIDVAAGWGGSCAITTEHRAVCWGSNAYGRIGNADLCSDPFICEPTTEPVFVTGDLVFDSIAAGEAHTCAITQAGAAYCWGAGSDGQLGYQAPESSCRGTGFFSVRQNCSTVPAAVDTDLTFRSLSIGGNFTCAMDTQGDAYCWGIDYDAQLGSGYPRTISISPRLVAGQPEPS